MSVSCNQKKGQSKRTDPVTRALVSAQPVYRQHASIFRQHAARSPQQSLAANARAVADIKIAPADTFKNEDFIMVSKKLKKILQRKAEVINPAESIFAKLDRWGSGHCPDAERTAFARSPIRAAGWGVLLGRCRLGTSACWRNWACRGTEFRNSRPASVKRPHVRRYQMPPETGPKLAGRSRVCCACGDITTKQLVVPPVRLFK